MHIVCPHCGDSAFRIPSALANTMEIVCVSCGKVTALDVAKPNLINVVKLVVPRSGDLHQS